MSLLFFLSVFGLFLTLPLHLWSLEHKKLEKKVGKVKGKKIARLLGVLVNLLHLLFLILFWLAPQPRFTFEFGKMLLFVLFSIAIYLSNFIYSLPALLLGLWLLTDSEKRLETETLIGHVKPKKIITSGSYSLVRHPQYTGSLLLHLGMSILLGGYYSLAISPVYFLFLFLTAKKEEEELVKEISQEYQKYQKKIPMFVPRLRRKS